jgi:hypothetical protein
VLCGFHSLRRPIFYVFVELGGLSTLRARAVLEQHGPFQCYVDSIRSGDRLSMFFDLGELSTLRARAVLEQHGPFLCYVDSIRSGDRFFIFF